MGAKPQTPTPQCDSAPGCSSAGDRLHRAAVNFRARSEWEILHRPIESPGRLADSRPGNLPHSIAGRHRIHPQQFHSTLHNQHTGSSPRTACSVRIRGTDEAEFPTANPLL